jgi:hypothetical protein
MFVGYSVCLCAFEFVWRRSASGFAVHEFPPAKADEVQPAHTGAEKHHERQIVVM